MSNIKKCAMFDLENATCYLVFLGFGVQKSLCNTFLNALTYLLFNTFGKLTSRKDVSHNVCSFITSEVLDSRCS